MNPLVIYPEMHLPPVVSLIATYGLAAGIPLVLTIIALVGWIRDRVLARRARAVEQSETEPAPGQTVVRGEVELARGASLAVRVEVEQLGAEHKQKSSYHHTWTEVGRRTLVHPFYVREPSGRRVRVEPSANVRIIDALDEVVRVRPDLRIRAAAITQREEVYVFGVLGTGPDPELADGYRGQGLGPVMRPAANNSMLIASASPAERFRASAFVHGLWVFGFAGLFCVAQMIHLFHNVRMIAGESAVASVVSKRHYTTKGSKGKTYHHYEVKTQLPNGPAFSQEVEEADWNRVTDGAPIAVVYVPGMRGYEELGDRSTVHALAAFVPLLLSGLLIAGYRYQRGSIRPWYERSVNERGSGRLPAMAENETELEPAIPQ